MLIFGVDFWSPKACFRIHSMCAFQASLQKSGKKNLNSKAHWDLNISGKNYKPALCYRFFF